MGALHRFNDVGVELVLDGKTGRAQSILDREWRTAAVGDDADTVHSEEWHAAVFVGVGHGVDGPETGFAKQGADLANGVGGQLALEQAEDTPGQGFARL